MTPCRLYGQYDVSIAFVDERPFHEARPAVLAFSIKCVSDPKKAGTTRPCIEGQTSGPIINGEDLTESTESTSLEATIIHRLRKSSCFRILNTAMMHEKISILAQPCVSQHRPSVGQSNPSLGTAA